MNGSTLATAADYADALLAARRAKRVLVGIIFLVLLAELTVFFIARYSADALPGGSAPTNGTVETLINYLLIAGGFAAFISALVLPAVLLVIVMIMICGRLIGVGRVTGALILSVVLLALLFPWQSVFLNPTSKAGLPSPAGDFRIPGVLYSWTEMIDPTIGARFAGDWNAAAVLRWARFVGWPVVGMIIVLAVGHKSKRGLQQALGETPAADPIEAAAAP